MAVDYKKKIGFKGQFYIEPKPKRADQAPVRFRRRRLPELSARPTTCSSISSSTSRPTTPRWPATPMQHELKVAAAAGALGSIDANTGDELLGWDTDQFPTNIYLTTQIMLVVLRMGGFTTGGAELRRQGAPRKFRAGRPLPRPHRRHGRLRPRASRSPTRSSRTAGCDEFVKNRYRSLDSGSAPKSKPRQTSFAELEKYALGLKRVAAARRAVARRCSRTSSMTLFGEA